MTVRSVLVRLRGDSSDLERAFARGAGAARAFTKELDTSNDRTATLVQSLVAIGPALVPLGAQAVPMVAGLTTQLTFAATAAGVTALAFDGIGDSLKAVNDYAMDPTEAHLKKMHEELGKLGPAGREFVMYLQELRPELQRLQNVAQEGMLPGVRDSIEELMTKLPQVERIVGEVSRTLGDLAHEGATRIAGPEWEDFFNYIETQAQPILSDMLRTVGNFAEGIGDLILAFDPLSQDFSNGFLEVSRDFAEWADNLDQTAGFQRFVEYIQESGPQVWDTLGALAEALIALTKAAAPVGEQVLKVLEVLAHGLTAIAESPAGPVLIGVAAGLSAISRAIALYNLVNGSALMSLVNKGAKDGEKAGLGLRGLAAGAGMLALAFTDLDDKSGFSNTMMLTLAGTMAGPWGAAAGAALGLTLDVAAANDKLEDAVDRADKAMAGTAAGGMEERTNALKELRAQNDAAHQSISDLAKLGGLFTDSTDYSGFADFLGGQFSRTGDAAKATGFAINNLFTNTIREGADAERELAIQTAALQSGLNSLYRDVSGEDRYISDVKELDSLLSTVIPALEQAGLDPKEVLGKHQDWDAAVSAVKDYVDSADGSVDNFGDAFADLGNEMMTTADAASALQTELDKLLGIQMTQDEANVKWKRALRELTKDLKGGADALNENTKKGQDNRDAIRDRVQALQDTIVADAAAGASQIELARKLKNGRDAILDAGEAAGIAREDMRKYLREIGLTPKMVRTAIELAGDQAAINRLVRLERKLGDVRRKARIKITAEMADRSGNPNHGLIEADGGIVSYYRNGGLRPRENHVAQIAPAGAWRVWAEPETGGEAYIPLAESKRSRSLDIWRETGRLLGVTFAEYANGAIAASRPAASRPASGMMRASGGFDYDRLAATMLRARPLYGDVYLQGDGSFRRAIEQDSRHAAIGGSRGAWR